MCIEIKRQLNSFFEFVEVPAFDAKRNNFGSFLSSQKQKKEENWQHDCRIFQIWFNCGSIHARAVLSSIAPFSFHKWKQMAFFQGGKLVRRCQRVWHLERAMPIKRKNLLTTHQWKLEKELGAFPSINSWIWSVWYTPPCIAHKSLFHFHFVFGWYCGWWLKLVEYIFSASLSLRYRLQMFRVHAPTAKKLCEWILATVQNLNSKHVMSVWCEFL